VADGHPGARPANATVPLFVTGGTSLPSSLSSLLLLLLLLRLLLLVSSLPSPAPLPRLLAALPLRVLLKHTRDALRELLASPAG
jgi:hypothetical protein